MPEKKMTEHQIQSSFIQWTRLSKIKYPQLEMAFAVPNGAHLAGDARTRAIKMVNLKRAGLKTGVPDWCLPFPCGGYAGLWIEFKSATGKLSDDQKEFIERLESYGHCINVCKTPEKAIRTVEEYLNPAKGF